MSGGPALVFRIPPVRVVQFAEFNACNVIFIGKRSFEKDQNGL
jgi:hypothetical protein